MGKVKLPRTINGILNWKIKYIWLFSSKRKNLIGVITYFYLDYHFFTAFSNGIVGKDLTSLQEGNEGGTPSREVKKKFFNWSYGHLQNWSMESMVFLSLKNENSSPHLESEKSNLNGQRQKRVFSFYILFGFSKSLKYF